jgi:hypothetical protein
MQSRVPGDPSPEAGYDNLFGQQAKTGQANTAPFPGLRTRDHLEQPTEPQATQADVNFGLELVMREMLGDIRRELVKSNPNVLCSTVLNGVNPIADTAPHMIRFEYGGKAVPVYRLLMWSQSGKAINASPTFMSTAKDGFLIPTTPTELHIPTWELYLCLGAAGTIGVNVPFNINTDGSVFVYGYTIEDYLNRRDYGEGQL